MEKFETKRAAIDELRDALRERSADTSYSNQFLYSKLMEQAKWLIRRDASSGRILRDEMLFDVAPCLPIITVPSTEDCPIETNCVLHRTKNKIPEPWEGPNGPLIKMVTSIDRSTIFKLTSPKQWVAKSNDPYQKKSNEKYCFYQDGYLWFPEHNPHLINLSAFFKDDLSLYEGDLCSDVNRDCVQFLDTKFKVPGWIKAELMTKALQLILGSTAQLPEDENINKNTSRK